MSQPLAYRDDEEQIYRQLAHVAGFVFIDLNTHYISAGIRRKLAADLVRLKRCVPLIFNDARVVVIVDDPFVAVAGGAGGFSHFTGNRELGFALASPSALRAFIERNYPLETVD